MARLGKRVRISPFKSIWKNLKLEIASGKFRREALSTTTAAAQTSAVEFRIEEKKGISVARSNSVEFGRISGDSFQTPFPGPT